MNILPTEPPSDVPTKTRFCIIRRALLTGAAVVLPLLATIWVIGFLLVQLWKAGDWLLVNTARMVLWIIDRLGQWDWHAERLTHLQIREEFFSWPVADLVRILLPLSIVGIIGAAALRGVWRSWFVRIEEWGQRVPVLGLIYKSVKQLIESFRGLGQQNNFQRVVYIDYPSPGCRLLAFVTGDFVDPDTDKPITVVFLPTSPNPLTGFTLLVDTEKVTECNIELEAALKLVFTAGLVTPFGVTADGPGAEGVNDKPDA